jgi:diphthamide biosynthesis methyltransferase
MVWMPKNKAMPNNMFLNHSIINKVVCKIILTLYNLAKKDCTAYLFEDAELADYIDEADCTAFVEGIG